MDARRGFTLLEMILFVAIFAVAMGAFMAVFTNVAGVQVAQSSAAEVRSQSQFLMQTVQYYVERSSAVEIPADISTTTLKLRMSSSTEDPVIFSLTNGGVSLQLAGGASTTITSNKVSVSSLDFVKRTNPGGHDSVSVGFTIGYNTQNPAQRFAQSLTTSVARVSAATFDSNLVPLSSGAYDLGVAAGDWKSINGTIKFSGSNVGIGVVPGNAALQVAGDVYVSNVGSGGIIFQPSSGVCYRLNLNSSGGIVTSTVTCP